MRRGSREQSCTNNGIVVVDELSVGDWGRTWKENECVGEVSMKPWMEKAAEGVPLVRE
jgi:hypothetical protein